MIAELFLAEVKKLEGVKYKDKGRNEYGLDCAGLLSFAARRIGIPHYDTLDYPRRPNSVDLMRGLSKTKQLSLLHNKWEFQNGDVGLFSTPSHPVHLGVLERDENGRMFVTHAWAPVHKVVRIEVSKESLSLPEMRLRRVYRYEENQ